MKKSLLGILVIGLLVAAEQQPKPDDLKEKLKGTWTMVSMEISGKKSPDEEVKGHSLIFEGEKAVHKWGEKSEDPATYSIDATKKPAHLDIMPTEGPEKGKTVKMIFEIDGDTLKIAGKMTPEERPTGFDEKDIMIMTLKREKK